MVSISSRLGARKKASLQRFLSAPFALEGSAKCDGLLDGSQQLVILRISKIREEGCSSNMRILADVKVQHC